MAAPSSSASESYAAPKPHLRRALLAYAVVIVIGLWAYLLWEIRADRVATLAAAHAQLGAIATAVSAHVDAMIHDGVGAAQAGANEIVARGRGLSFQEMAATLRRMLTGGEYVREVFFATPDLFVSAGRTPDPSDFNQRPAWANEMLALQTESSWVGGPVEPEHGNARAAILIARKVGAQPGDYWAGAVFGIDALNRLYAGLLIEQGTVALVSAAGTVLVRVPASAERNFVGTVISDSEAFRRLRASNQKTFKVLAPNPVTGIPWLYAAEQIPEYPLYAVAGREVEIALAPWRARRQRSIELAAVSTVAFLVLTVALYRLLSRRYEALQQSEARFQLTVAGSNDGIWDWDVKTNRVYYSPRLKEQLGATAPDAMPPTPESFWERIHPDDLRRIQLAVQRHLLHRDSYDVEYRVRARGGDYRWFRARAQAVWNAAGDAVRMAGSITDIHDKKLAEQSLEQARAAELHAREEFAQNLLLAQERERQRLANELHDSVGQTLSLIKNRVLLAQQTKDAPMVTEHLTALSSLASDVIAEVRTVAHNLRPPHLEQLGITDAIVSLLDQIQAASELRIARRIENVDDALDPEAATHLFRIVQEGLNNTLKHAGASECRVTLERDVSCVRFVLADNGKGFEPGAKRAKAGLGLASIVERTHMLAGTYDIEAAPDRGTRLCIEIPIGEPQVLDRTA